MHIHAVNFKSELKEFIERYKSIYTPFEKRIYELVMMRSISTLLDCYIFDHGELDRHSVRKTVCACFILSKILINFDEFDDRISNKHLLLLLGVYDVRSGINELIFTFICNGYTKQILNIVKLGYK